ncbi:MAG: bifunctional diaminohydroxyphosphoribosylaminopyrimidine deaminase/5-amino-6-(5-phosphoribosylamino)uracil reductase RibD [Bacteroidales bacterium]|nr:bifunctional diaminohydroxyphosphoribosylaminopyrimidine deaminase/5-amino-6-(5-phosphoribosylamino)uracil reductase RibD [Bacteroidales bacterium]MBN2750412.1 bifunctional diaminohydroxyphosphoribosylaminopyrimidine deaminase/5-amino-6-(5-phosphoribosylamino)uracil reductase RibD [Bacteroidales bacterium]
MDRQRIDEIFMARCLDLARCGEGNVSPNPMVGAVVVHNGTIIGEGYHIKHGQAHAEVNAIAAVKDKSLLPESTIYVNLEPCSHFGKTPPCANLIKEMRIPRIVVAATDPNPLVAGRGVDMLRKAGREVTVGVLEHEALELNRRFYTFHTQKRPYVILKWAQTLDGYIDAIRKEGDPIAPIWITNELSRRLVHRWRSEEPAIMVGTNTVEKDNPKLNVRDWSGRSPLRVVLDRKLRLSVTSSVFDGSVPTLVFMGNNASASQRKPELQSIPGVELLTIDFAKGVEQQVLTELYQRGVLSVIVEGGAALINNFVRKNLWDESRVFVGNTFFGDGVKAPNLTGELYSYDEIGDSKLFTYRNK